MKTFARLLFLVVLLAAVGWGVHFWMEKREEKDAESAEAVAPEAEAEAAPGVVKIEEETQELLGLEIADLEAATLHPELRASGRVLDPTPLVILEAELDAAEASLEMSRAANERAQGLFKSGENVARKNVESAEAQFRLDEIKLRGLGLKLAMEWGEAFAKLDAKERRGAVEKLASGTSALIRVDLAAGENAPQTPRSARLALLGREAEPLTSESIAPASSIDPKTQAQGFLVRVEEAAFALRPGMALTAWLELPGEELHGVNVPRAAVVRANGFAWVYVQKAKEEFERRVLEGGVPAAEGLFVEKGFKAGEKIVAIGAQGLLSAEAIPLGAGAEEEEEGEKKPAAGKEKGKAKD